MAKTTHPMIVDLDGTLIRSDLLVESFFGRAASAPLSAATTFLKLSGNRAALKAAFARDVPIDPATLPYNTELLTWLKEQKAKGRTLYLASASHESYVNAIAEHLGIFEGVFASDGATNLKSHQKAEALVAKFGAKQFDYVGNEAADFAVWEQANEVVLTNADAAFTRQVQQRFPTAHVITTSMAVTRDYLRALRPHQWLKNLLIFVPLLAAHLLDTGSIALGLLAFLSFSLCASSGYILNDLLDLQHDRAHHSKCRRPLAAGTIDIGKGVLLMIASLGLSLILGVMLSFQFLLVLLAYYALSLTYSMRLKRHMILDVVALSLLYGVRLVAGGVALGIALSPWLLTFSSFFFLSLALIKRCSELIARKKLKAGDPAGRGYRLTDLPMLESMAVAAGYVAALTSGLYINGENVFELYRNPQWLWAVPIILLYWISRMLLLTHRGEMHDDPVLFAARDRVSLICGGLIFLVLLVSM